jgi:hypothetical protein
MEGSTILYYLLQVFLPDTSKGTRVSFAEVLVTDGLTSLSKVLADIEVIVCFILAHIRYAALLIVLLCG